MKFIITFFLCLSIQAGYSIGSYKKGDKLYNWSPTKIPLYTKPNAGSKVVSVLSFEEECIVIDDDLKKTPHTVLEINPKEDAENDFKGFSLSGFWVKVKTNDGKTGYVFDAYFSKIKPGFELSTSYFDQEFKLMNAKIKKPDPKKDNAYSKSYFYKNGASIIQNGTDYDISTCYFIPNISLEEGYFFLKSTNHIHPSQDSETYGISTEFDGTELSFSSTIENTSIKKIDTKTRKGIEIWLEASD
jgi:hypothetical protein